MAMPPDQLIAGITSEDCCTRCSADHGCVITSGGPCGHPAKAGGLPPRLQADPVIRKAYAAARALVTVGIRARREAGEIA